MKCPICEARARNVEEPDNYAIWMCDNCFFKWLGPTTDEIQEFKKEWFDLQREIRREHELKLEKMGLRETDQEYQRNRKERWNL